MTTLTSTQPSTPQKFSGKAQEPKLFHPALQFDPFSTLCSYNNLQSLYATVDASSLQPKVLIYNVKDSKPVLDFTLLEGPSTNKITCLKWLTKPEVNTKKPSNKDPFSRYKNCLLIGFQTGEIFIYSLIESSIIIKFSGHHNGAINDIFQLEELIFAGSADEHLSLWDLSKGELIKYWRPNNGQITKLIANKKSSQLICAGNSLQIWDYEDFTLLKTLRGHTGSISTLDYFGSQDRYFLSSSPHDPLVNVWDRLHDSQLPIAVLDLKTHLPCQLIGAKFSTTYSAVVLTSDGLVLTYNDVLNIERNSHLPSATLKFYNPQNNSILPVSSLTWDKSYNLPLVARGLPTTPIFETLQVKLKLLKGPELYPREDIQQTSNSTGLDSKVQQEAMDLIVGTSFAQTITSTQVNSKFMVPTAIATAQRLNLLDEGRGDSPSVTSGTNTGNKVVGDGKATTGSVIQLLSQALHTMDYDMLDSHLNTFNSPTLVQTIPHLETRHLVPLLTYLSNQLEFSNHTSIKALTLINALLTYHVGYLTSQPKAVHRLHQLMEGSKRRTSHYSQLVKLEGELELVQNRINLRKQTFFNEGSLVFKEARGYLNSKEQGENFEGEEEDEEDKMDLIEFDDYEDDDSELEGSDEENSDEDDSENEQLIEDDLSKEARLEANLNKNGFFDDEEDSDEDSNDELANGNHDSDENDEELEEDDDEDIEEESEEDDLDDLDLPTTTSNKRKPNGVHQRKRAKH